MRLSFHRVLDFPASIVQYIKQRLRTDWPKVTCVDEHGMPCRYPARAREAVTLNLKPNQDLALAFRLTSADVKRVEIIANDNIIELVSHGADKELTAIANLPVWKGIVELNG